MHGNSSRSIVIFTDDGAKFFNAKFSGHWKNVSLATLAVLDHHDCSFITSNGNLRPEILVKCIRWRADGKSNNVAISIRAYLEQCLGTHVVERYGTGILHRVVLMGAFSKIAENAFRMHLHCSLDRF